MVSKAKVRVLEARIESTMKFPGLEGEHKSLPVDKLYSLLERAEEALPDILERMIETALGDKCSASERRHVFTTLTAFVLAEKRMERDMGLVRGMLKGGDVEGDIFAKLLGGNTEGSDVDARLLELSKEA